ncbi:ErfK/YbiS/YcfS/YnhG family protein [Clostridium acetobutylicum]|nr:ErfK/YbiS/YcfS/YnhG family protein [Clostridium acetobutylicum]
MKISKFQKIIFALILILIIEIILVIQFYKMSPTNSKLSGYNSKEKILIVIDVVSNKLCVFQNDKLLKTYTIAGGKPSTPSPIGTWTIVGKDTWGEGFGGRWMGFNVPWGKYGIHGTIFPDSIGGNTSHGCIRMRNDDVRELYKITPVGTKVIVQGGPYGNFGSYLRNIKPGDRGSDVYEVQKILREKGYYNGTPDGIYGEGMKYCIHKFQKDNNLYISDIITRKFYEKLGVDLTE